MLRQSIFSILVGGCAGALVTGCASSARQATLPATKPLQHDTALVQAASTHQEASEASGQVTGILGLKQVIALALLQNPDLQAYAHEVRAAEARTLQAGLLPNPRIKVQLEEYDRDGAGTDSAEAVISVGQLFELGAKRRWRTGVAAAQGELAGWEYEGKRLEVIAATAQRFIAVMAAQQHLDLAESTVELAEKTSLAVRERMMAGKEPAVQVAKSEAELETARMRAAEASNNLGAARRKLAAMWGSRRVAFESVEGNLDGVLGSTPSLGCFAITTLLQSGLGALGSRAALTSCCAVCGASGAHT